MNAHRDITTVATSNVSQVEDERLAQVANDSRYVEATTEVLHKHGGLWFSDEST